MPSGLAAPGVGPRQAVLPPAAQFAHCKDVHDGGAYLWWRNNRTSPYLWGFAMLTVLPAVLFWNQTPLLMLFVLIFIVSYVWAYTRIIRFKVPRWLRR